jgi:PAS domain S-box-containing protein
MKRSNFETIRCKKNGTCIDVSITVSPIKDAAGDIIGFSTIARDITERKNAEEALRKSEAWLSTTLRSIGDAVIATDAKGRVVFINPIATKLTGWKQEEAAGRPMGEIFNIINEITNEPVENPVTKVIQEGVIVGLANHTLLITKDGSRRPIDDSAAPIKDTKGNIIGVVLIFRDITERRNTEKAMQESVKAKSAFTSMVSHELRTPLGAIKEGVSLISDGILGEISEKQKHVLGLAKNNVDRLTRLINQVLDFQTLEAGKIQFKMEENDINKVIREVAETMDLIAKKKGLDLVLYLEDKLPRVIFDRDKINQVLANLIGNAIKFTDKGSVTVAASSGNNLIMVSIKDTGIGIRKENLPRLFRQYEQLERKAGGTGLGLAISAEMIRMHGGKIGAESEFGKGTTFYFILPVKERRDRSRDE